MIWLAQGHIELPALDMQRMPSAAELAACLWMILQHEWLLLDDVEGHVGQVGDRWLPLSSLNSLPIDVVEELMLFYFFDSFEMPQALSWILDQQLLQKILALWRQGYLLIRRERELIVGDIVEECVSKI